jgi:hypothetical protein
MGDSAFAGASHGNWAGRFSKGDTKSWTEPLKEAAKLKELAEGEFWMTVQDFKRGFKYFTITYLDQQRKNSFVEKRSSINRRLYKFNFTVSEQHLTSSEED